MILTAISDTHCRHLELNIPKSDILIHCGDFSNIGTEREAQAFMNWFANQSGEKILIAGNHDDFAEYQPILIRTMAQKLGIHYLENSEVTLKGLRFWGSPINPRFGDMAFNRTRGDSIRSYWNQIPQGIDVLMTHSPPYGIQDYVPRTGGGNVGCRDLAEVVEIVKPRYHFFGHIHEAYGMVTKDGTTFYNVTSMGNWNSRLNKPVTIKIEARDAEPDNLP